MVRFWVPGSGFWEKRGCALGLFLAFMLIGLQDVAAQQVRAYLSADSVRIGDRFSLTIVAEHTLSTDPIFPGIEAGEEMFGDLEVIGIQSGGSLAVGDGTGARIDSLLYEVTTFALDTAYVPSIPVFFVAGEDTFFVAAYPMELPIISLVTEEASGIRDLAPIADFPINPWPWILGVLLFVGVLATLYHFWKKYRKEAPAPEIVRVPEPKVSPLEEAIQRLRNLEKNSDLKDVSQIKPFYVELTEIMRVYLSRRLKINAMESTSHELMWELKRLAQRRRVSQEMLQYTRRILNVADLVKFADMRPAPEVGHQAFRETRKVIDEVEMVLKQLQQAAANARNAAGAPAVRPVPADPSPSDPQRTETQAVASQASGAPHGSQVASPDTQVASPDSGAVVAENRPQPPRDNSVTRKPEGEIDGKQCGPF